MPIAASRSITCTFGKRSNRRTHLNDVVVPDREPLALDELDDGAVLESIEGISIVELIKRPECHAVADAASALDDGFGVVKDRGGASSV